MKHTKTLIFILLMVALFWPSTAFAKDVFDDKVVFGGTFTLESGESQEGSLVVFGGAVTIEPDSTVNGDVVLMGGTIEVGGQVNGNVVGIGGAVRLNEDATINGDLFTLGAALRREDGAMVNGQVVNGFDIPDSLSIPDDIGNSGITPPTTPIVNVNTNPILDMIWFFFRTFMFSALAVLLVMFLPAHVDRVTQAALSQPVITAGAGLLTAVLAPLALVVVTITIIGIPVTLVAVVLLFAAWLIGWVALGVEVGRRIAKALNMEWAPAISAGVGTLILFFVFGGFSELIPCIGWIPQTLVSMWGLGAVLMTRFGTQDYAGLDSTEHPVDAKFLEDSVSEDSLEVDSDELVSEPEPVDDELIKADDSEEDASGLDDAPPTNNETE